MAGYIIDKIVSRVESEVNRIERMRTHKSGLFFKTHKYSKDLLIMEVEDIESEIGSMSDVVENWVRAGAITTNELKDATYKLGRAKTKLENLMRRIERRENTFWESVRKPIIKVIVKISDLLGIIPSGLIENAAATIKRLR